MRVKRWLNTHGREFNSDGSLKPEARAQMLSTGMTEGAITSYTRRMQKKYNHLKQLDETEPEPWPIYTAYDFFTEEEKRQFNPDGSLKPEYKKEALSMGISQGWLEEMERRKKIEIDNYNELSTSHAEIGINFGEQQMNSLLASRRNYEQNIQQTRADLRNFEDLDSLLFDVVF